ncbi:type II toxin-antitoxin system RelE/ParE family toxin [Halopseudomonas bauzanensis]|uniref:type II toxin-antitoxin system RelE/ParE family toxin n=1 Tax=Halopseudomonas bauzanensis TaxID=653930 RepID=UPI0035269AFF
MEARFEQIAELPSLYPVADHIKPRYRQSVYVSHTIYYRTHEHGVLIVRILRNQEPSTGW